VPTFADLRDARPGLLLDAAQEFWDFASWLDREQRVVSDDAQALTLSGEWEGDAAEATLARYRGLDQVFEGGKTEYRAVCAILRDACADITAAKKKLTDAIADAQAHELVVADDGGLTWGPLKPQGHQPDPEDVKAHGDRMRDLADDCQRRFKAAVEEATDADARAARALRGDIGNSATSFNAAAIGGGDFADAARAANLAKRVDTLSPAELEELRNLLHANEKSPVFSTGLMNSIGPKGLLDLQTGLINQGEKWTGHDLDGDAMADLRAIQDTLGTNLATATGSRGEPTVPPSWIEGLKQAGQSKTFALSDMPQHYVYGYQLLGNLLNKGDYDKKFLGDVGKDMVAFDRAHPDMAKNVPAIRERFPLMDDPQGHEGRGYDPMNGLMEALGRNPGAAEAVLDPNGGDNLKYFLKDRDWGADTGPGSPADSFGKAFESAATGHPAGAGVSGGHTEAGARIMAESVHLIGQDGPGAHFADYRDSFADAMASYMPDIHNELRNERAGGSAGPDPLFPNSPEARATFVGGTPDHDLLRTMAVVAEDPQAFKAMSDAEHSYIALGLERISAGGDPPPGLTADQHLAQSAQVVGSLDAVRTEAIRHQQVLSDKEYNDQVTWDGKTANAVIGGAVKMSPLPGTVSEPLSRLIALTTDHAAQQHHVDTAGAADRTIADQHAWGRGYMQTIAGDWAQNHGRESELPGYDITVDNNFTTGQRKAQEALGRE
jgi:hypothetical protein